jgi:hypothetical protein
VCPNALWPQLQPERAEVLGFRLVGIVAPALFIFTAAVGKTYRLEVKAPSGLGELSKP